jgi:hypothetical protein
MPPLASVNLSRIEEKRERKAKEISMALLALPP